MIYRPDIRINNPIYLLRQVEELLKLAVEYKNSSSLIYASLECRIALELLDLNFLLASVKKEDREQIMIGSKPKNGINQVDKQIVGGVLKHKYQLFFQAICEICGFKNQYYDFKKSKDLQHELSEYIHSYHLTDDELKYGTEIMNKCHSLIVEVDEFIKQSLPKEDNSWLMLGIEIESLPEEDKISLEKWKISNSMTYEDLKEQLSYNFKIREQN